VVLVDDQWAVEAFAAGGADPPLRESVCAWGLRRGLEDAGASCGEHSVEGPDELRVPVAHQELHRLSGFVQDHDQVAGLLGHPVTGGVAGDAEQVDPAAADIDGEEHVDPAQENGVDGEEVAGEHRAGLGAAELSPGRPGPPWRWVETGGGEDVPEGGRGQVVAEVHEFTVDASVAPARVLPGQAQHQRADRGADRWPA